MLVEDGVAFITDVSQIMAGLLVANSFDPRVARQKIPSGFGVISE